MRSLVQLLQSVLSIAKLELIQTALYSEESEVKFTNTMKLLLSKNVIQKNLVELSKIFIAIEHDDIAEKLEAYKEAFENISEQEFLSKFRKELARVGKQMSEWEDSVKRFLETQFQGVWSKC